MTDPLVEACLRYVGDREREESADPPVRPGTASDGKPWWEPRTWDVARGTSPAEARRPPRVEEAPVPKVQRVPGGSVGEEIRALRVKLGLSQRQAADLVGVSRGNLATIEGGQGWRPAAAAILQSLREARTRW